MKKEGVAGIEWVVKEKEGDWNRVGVESRGRKLGRSV